MNPSALTPSFVFASSLGLVIGFLTMAYNTGSIFGLKTVPKPWLPYVGLALMFLIGFTNQQGSASLSASSLYLDFIQGVLAMLSNGGGAAIHSLVTAHKSSRGQVALGNGPPCGPSISIDVDPPETKVIPPGTHNRIAALGLGLFVIVFCTGASCQVPPQTQAEINASIELGACMENVYATDSQKTPPTSMEQIAIDEGTVCGADAAQVITVFSQPAANRPAIPALVEVAQHLPDSINNAAKAHHAGHKS